MPLQASQNLSRPQLNAPRRKLDWALPSFGTLDTTTDVSEMDELNSPDTLNTVYDTVGSVASRMGYTKLLTTNLNNPINGMAPLYKSDGTRQLVYGSTNNLYSYNNAGGSNVLPGTPTTFTSNVHWNFDEYNDSLYGGNGFDPLIAYNGTSYQIVNSGITPQYVKVHRNRVYCANLNSSTLYFSDAGSPNSFPFNNFIQINTNDGQVITGIAESGDNLVIFKSDSIWILTGEPLGVGNSTTIGNLQLQKLATPVGCSAFATITQVDTALFFFHYSGVYALQNNTVTEVLPLLSTTFQSGMNPGFIQNSWATYNPLNNYFLLGYPSSTSTVPDRVIAYSTLSHRASIWDDVPGSVAVNFKFSGTKPTIVMGGSVKGCVYTLFNGYADIAGDNGTATSGSTSSINDTTKTWTSNQFVDARVKIYSATGAVLGVSTVIVNTSTSLTLLIPLAFSVTAGMTYSIGYYDSYWTTKNLDFGLIGYTKKFRFFNMFADAENYNILFGSSIDYAALDYQKQFLLTSSAPVWGTMVWGSFVWGGSSSTEFAQANIGGTGRYCRFKFGNNLANRPWRVSRASISYKIKKQRPNVVTT